MCSRSSTAEPAERLGPLISREQLATLLKSADPPVVIDVRWRLGGPPGLDSYLAGHLPGARFIDLDTELSGPPGLAGRHPLPDTPAFEAAMRRLGLRAGQLAVAYDDGDSTIAARLWWMLKYYGHRRAAVLDGGYRAWTAAGMPVTDVVTRPEPGDFAVTAVGDMPVLDDVEAGRLARSGFLLDARAGERYRGEVEPIDRAAGHIPGALSVPTRDNVDVGLPTSPEQASDVDGQPVIGAYCGSGVTAAHEVLALELAGLPAALYVGSWSQWSFDPARPIATGADPG